MTTAGGEPTVVPEAAGQSLYEDPTLQHIAETPGLPPDVVRGLIALARNWRDQEQGREEDGRQEERRRRA